MAERPFIDWIVEAFQNLQNRAHLSQAYEEVRRLGYDRGGEDLDKICPDPRYRSTRETPHGSLEIQRTTYSPMWEMSDPEFGSCGNHTGG